MYFGSRFGEFRHLASDMEEKVMTPKPLCPTRWTVRVKSVQSILSGYGVILELMENLAKANEPFSAKANGLKCQLEKGETVFGFLVCVSIFEPIERLSLSIQNKSITVSGVKEAAEKVLEFLEGLKQDENFNNIWNLDYGKHILKFPPHPMLFT